MEESKGGDEESSSHGDGDDSHDRRTGDYYAKGTYQYAQQPVVTAMSTASDTNENSLQTKAQLAGVVDINFKSDYFPLEKMADSFQISKLQAAATPGRGAGAAAAATPPATPPAATATPAPAAAPAR